MKNSTEKKERTFISDSGTKVTTTDNAEIKRYKACGWRELKPTKIYYAKGLSDGKTFLN
jgi:hypothetical protein